MYVSESPAKKVCQEARPLCQGKLEEPHEEGSFEMNFSQERWGKGSFQGVGEGREVGEHTAFTRSTGTGEGRVAKGWDPGMMYGNHIMSYPRKARIKNLRTSLVVQWL